MAELPPPPEGIVLAHFIVSDDVERSRRFYTEVLGGRVVFSGDVTYVALANTWIIINVGGGPTDDKPSVILETPRDPNRVSSFLNIRVKDIHAVYAEWSARGAQFLTPPKQHQYEIRCYIRDPDGYLIEVGQTTDPKGDWTPAHWPPSTRGLADLRVTTAIIGTGGLGSGRASPANSPRAVSPCGSRAPTLSRHERWRRRSVALRVVAMLRHTATRCGTQTPSVLALHVLPC